MKARLFSLQYDSAGELVAQTWISDGGRVAAGKVARAAAAIQAAHKRPKSAQAPQRKAKMTAKTKR